MALRWTMESVFAAGAVLVSTMGGLATAAIHWGSVDTQIEAVQTHQRDQDKNISENRDALSNQKQHDATIEQKLDDMIERLDRIEKEL